MSKGVARQAASRVATAGAATVLTLLTWPIRPRHAEFGVDASYAAALALASERGLQHGTDILFNYGPLGYLSGDLFTLRTGALAWLAQIVVAVALSWQLVSLFNRRVNVVLATVAGAAVLIPIFGGTPMGFVTRVSILAVLWSISRVAAGRTVVWSFPTAAIAGALCGLAVLVKADLGLFCTATVGTATVLGAWLTRGRRAAAQLVGSWLLALVATVGILFIAIGGSAHGLTRWATGSTEIARTFSGSLGLTRSGGVAMLEHAGTFVILLCLGLFILRRTDVDHRLRWALVGLAYLASYLAFRQGFTRYDNFHVRQFFAVIVMLPVALLPLWSLRRVAGFVVAAFLVFLPGQHPGPSIVSSPIRSVVAAGDTIATLVVPGRLNRRVEQRRDAIRARYPSVEPLVETIGDGTVAIIPNQTEVALGYRELAWRPLPVFQDYQATSVWLDDQNRDALAGSDRPDWVLRLSGDSVDHAFPRFDPPGENLALLCSYVPQIVKEDVQLLAATDDRCGSLEPLGSVEGTLGSAVPLPEHDPDSLVLARFEGVGAGWPARLATIAYRGPTILVEADGASYRFDPMTQGSWHVVHAPACVSLTGTGLNLDEISLAVGDAIIEPDPGFSVEFATVPIECDPPQ